MIFPDVGPLTCAKDLANIVVRIFRPTHSYIIAQGWASDCPRHRKGNRALDVKMGDDGVPILACEFGCSAREIWIAVGIDADDVRGSLVRWASAPPEPSRRGGKRASPELALDVAIMEAAASDLEAGRMPPHVDYALRLALAIRRAVMALR